MRQSDHGSHGMVGPGGEILVYRNSDDHVRLEVRLQDETVWLTQAHLAELFQVKPQNITMHLTEHLCGRGIGGRGNV